MNDQDPKFRSFRIKPVDNGSLDALKDGMPVICVQLADSKAEQPDHLIKNCSQCHALVYAHKMYVDATNFVCNRCALTYLKAQPTNAVQIAGSEAELVAAGIKGIDPVTLPDPAQIRRIEDFMPHLAKFLYGMVDKDIGTGGIAIAFSCLIKPDDDPPAVIQDALLALRAVHHVSPGMCACLLSSILMQELQDMLKHGVESPTLTREQLMEHIRASMDKIIHKGE